MTARCYPAELQEVDGRRGEYAVWKALRTALPDDAVLLHGVKVLDGPNGRELDFVVVWPGVGVGVIEVKGGTVWSDEHDVWWMERAGKKKQIENPMAQVETARHALHRFLEKAGSPAAKARTQHLVVLPHTSVPENFDPSECPRAQVVDREQLARVVPILRDLVEKGSGHAPLDASDVPAFVNLFVQQLVPDATAAAAEHEERAEQMAVQQLDVLDLLSRQKRFTLIGGAGTGKTVLAVEQAHRLAQEGKRVALVCYSRGLGRYLQQRAATWKKPPAYVGLFHDLALQWGAPPPPEGDKSAYYEEELPRFLGEAAVGRPDLFDAVVVDEAQDFGDLWWPSLMECLKDKANGGVFIFMDEGQRVFQRKGAAPVDGEPFLLRRNFRNTKRIAQTFGSLAADEVRFHGHEGTNVRFVQCSAEDAVSMADDVVDALLDVWEPGQIALLTTKNRHPIHREIVEFHGDEAYWDVYFEGEDVFYSSVSGFKGLERTCVILTVNGFSSEAQAKEMLYVGLSRARSQLVVVGDLEEIAKVGGEGVRRRLEAAERWTP
jgi:hypothetical protein